MPVQLVFLFQSYWLCSFDRKQAYLWAAGRVVRQGTSDAVGKPKLDGCLVTVVNSLSLDDNQNCETLTVAVDDNDNMACILIAIIVMCHSVVLYLLKLTIHCLSTLLVMFAAVLLCLCQARHDF